MLKRYRLFFVFAVSAALASSGFASDQIPAPPQSQPIALTGGDVYPVDGAMIENGTILFDEGEIVAVGTGIDIPADALRINVSGKRVYPGLFAVNTRLGLTEIEAVDMTLDYSEGGSINSNVRPQAAFNPDSELIPVARANGITLAHVAPRGGRIPGGSAVMMLDGWTWEDMTLKAPAGMMLNFPGMGVDRGNEGDSRRNRDNQLNELSELLAKTRAYQKARAANDEQGGGYQETDVRLEALVPVVNGDLPLIVSANGVEEIQGAISFADDEDVKIVITGGRNAWRIAERLIERDIPVIVEETHSLSMRSWEPYDTPFTLPLKLHEAGIRFCIGFGPWSSDMNARNLPYHAATAAAYGLPKDEALKAVTLYPAEILGVGDRVGSLAAGKDATLIVTDGDPLEVTTQVERMFIQGRDVDLSSRHTQLYEKYKTKYEQLSESE